MKRLISAEVVRQEYQAGTRRIEVSVADSIVTPEARSVAAQIGLEIVDCANASVACSQNAAPADAKGACQQGAAKAQEDGDLAAVRAAVLAELPNGSVPPDVVDLMVQKVVAEKKAKGACPTGDGSYQSTTNSAGVKSVCGASVKMGIFNGAAQENCVGCTDVVTAADGSPMGAGFMEWENSFFPWKPKYDEVDYVIEGELHIRCGNETTVGKAGDVIFIPKGSNIEFGTPSRVRFFYVAYPANWAEK